DPGSPFVRVAKLQLPVGHVDAIYMPVRSHPAGCQQDVQAPAAAQVEHDLALTELGQKHWIPAAEAQGIGQADRLELSGLVRTSAAAVWPIRPATTWRKFGPCARKPRELPGRVPIPGLHRLFELAQGAPPLSDRDRN